jgi:hypothetical protein
MNPILHGAVRGAIAAMAMTGMRQLTTDLGLVDRPPPQAIFRERIPGPLRSRPRRKRRITEELAHWSYGSVGGAVYAALPEGVRRRPWSGPLYGLAVWLGFEAGLSPVLRLSHSKKPRLLARAALAADHALYGFVLSETRRQPRQ